jgi:hypothetical protein
VKREKMIEAILELIAWFGCTVAIIGTSVGISGLLGVGGYKDKEVVSYIGVLYAVAGIILMLAAHVF